MLKGMDVPRERYAYTHEVTYRSRLVRGTSRKMVPPACNKNMSDGGEGCMRDPLCMLGPSLQVRVFACY
jgi:hypothetical protein